MWLKESKRLIVVDVLHEWYKKKHKDILKSPIPMTIPKMAVLIHAVLKDTSRELSIKSIEMYLYELKDEGFMRCVKKEKKSPGRNGESSLYVFCLKKFDKSYINEIKEASSFKILDRIWTILEA